MPSILEMHTSEDMVEKWVKYATVDAESTFFLREVMVRELAKFKVEFEDMNNLFDLYCKYWLPFGELLTDIERNGIKVDRAQLQAAEAAAMKDLTEKEEKFMSWIRKTQESAHQFNPSSTQQLQQLLYAPFKRIEVTKPVSEDQLDMRDFAGNEEEPDEDPGLQAVVKKPRNIDVVNDFPEEREFKVENSLNIQEEGKDKALKYTTMKIKGLGIPPKHFSASGLPSVDVSALNALAGDPQNKKYGDAYTHFK